MINACRSSRTAISNNESISVTQFGAIPNDEKPDDQAFREAFEYLRANGGDRLVVPQGRYYLSKKVQLLNWIGDLSIIGEGEVSIELIESDFLFINQDCEEQRIGSDLLKGQGGIRIKNPRNVLPGQILHIHSNSAYEVGWGYKENDIHKVHEVQGSHLKLSSRSLFNYNQNKEEINIKTYQNNALIIRNINFILNVEMDRVRHTMITVQRLAIDLMNVSFKVKGGEGYFHRGVAVSGAYGCSIKEVALENLEYGILLNFCRNIKASNISALRCRHAITPSTASVDIKLDNITGERCQGVLDAHAAFNVSANRIRDMKAIQFSNFRAIGVEILNSFFELGVDYTQDYAYWSAQTLVPEYHEYYKEHDVIFRDVKWIHKSPGNFNGLTAYSCRNLIVERCTTHNISLYGVLYGKVDILASRIGNIRVNSHNIKVSNSTMDGSLFPNSNYVIHLTGRGETLFEGVKFVNYKNSTYLFDKFYNTDNYNSVTLRDCSVQALKGWTHDVYYPKLDYNKLYIVNTKLEGISKMRHPIFFNTKDADKNIHTLN